MVEETIITRSREEKRREEKRREEKRREEKRIEEKRREEKRREEKRREEKTTPSGVNLMRSQVLYWAAQGQQMLSVRGAGVVSPGRIHHC